MIDPSDGLSALAQGFVHHRLQQPLDFALLVGLAVDPDADRLLLGAHVLHQCLDGFGQIGHRGGSDLAAASLIDRGTQALNRVAHFCGAAGGEGWLGCMVVDRGGEPVLQFGVEAVLRAT